MNFFGHAIVASFRSREPAFVLGAMLPDFATMIGERVPAVTDAGLERGVAFHHDTDRVFHASRIFRGLELEARRELRDLGVPRPSALAVAHVGVEILIDARLTIDDAGVSGYLGALAAGHQEREGLGRRIGWARGEGPSRYETLRSVLVQRGVTRGVVDASTVTFRVARALHARPRLRLPEAAEPLVEEWVARAAPRVAATVPALLAEVTEGLGLEMPEVHRAGGANIRIQGGAPPGGR